MSRRIAVVGGGAAGTVAAVHLLRERRQGPPLEIELLDRDGSFGPGVAYRTEDPWHLLNVPACRMGAIAGRSEDFHEWLGRRGRALGEAAFVSRGVYGEYLRELLDEAERDAVDARLRRRRAEVVAVAEGAGGSLELTLAGGERLAADALVLALGPLPGGDPVPPPGDLDAGVYVADPWAPGALEGIGATDSVLIVGTGLTMVDVALTLGREERGPALRAVSRHGLVPRAHRRALTEVDPFPIPLEDGDLDAVVTAVFERIAAVTLGGGDWRDVIDSMRPGSPALWRALRLDQKRRFLAGMQRLWDVHRFRMAPAVAERFAGLTESGRLQIEAGAVTAFEARPGGARVVVQSGADEPPRAIEADRVINCAGAGHDVARRPTPLIANLFESGLARPDELGIGLDVDPEGGLIDARGRASERIQVIGALRKGVEWETIGITEIRDQAGVAARRLGAVDGAAAPRLALPVPPPVAVEEAA